MTTTAYIDPINFTDDEQDIVVAVHAALRNLHAAIEKMNTHFGSDLSADLNTNGCSLADDLVDAIECLDD